VDTQSIITFAYLGTLALLGVYGLHRLALLARFRFWRARPSDPPEEDALPTVTVQLPLYNERTVARRLIRAAGSFDYPAAKLELQILDDSTDETCAIVDEEVRALVQRGIDAKVLRRDDRVGFKAGALDHGMRQARGDLLCIFDADFMPEPGFLRDTVGSFRDPAVGMVQARWGHVNREESLLTRAQSTLLDGHFVIEHTTRCDAGLFFNFNGTAGIWRRAAIEAGGGWQHDTLTEDLDLSYRVQLAGWQFVYMPHVVAPAEVPPGIGAFKSQQHRWAKGSVQVFRKLAWRILRSHEPARVKLEALAHLTGNVGYPCVLLLALVLPLVASVRSEGIHLYQLALFLLCTVSVVLFYERSQRAVGRPLAKRLCDSFAAISLGIGMCVSQTHAVLAGLSGETGVFVRTPKRGEATFAPYRQRFAGLPGFELLLAGWCAWGVLAASRVGNWGSLPFLFLFFFGFAWVGVLSLREHFATQVAPRTG